VSQKRVPP